MIPAVPSADVDDVNASAPSGTAALASPLQRRIRLFADQRDQPRRRRATDGVLLGAMAATLGLLAVAARPQPGVSRSLQVFLTSLPRFLDGVWQIAVDLPLVISVAMIVAALVRRRAAIARDVAFAAVVAGLLAVVLVRLADGVWLEFFDDLRRSGPPSLFPVARLSIAGAMLVTVSPHLVLPVRRLQRWLLALAAVAAVAIGAATPIGAAVGLVVAVVAATLIHLLVGSSAGRPSLGDVEAALAELGVPFADLSEARSHSTGVFLVNAVAPDGAELLVKVYGRDAYDMALLVSLWRTVWLREPGSAIGVGRLRQVEHEAFLTLLAAQAGIVTDVVVTAGATASDDAVLALRRTGHELVPESPNDVDTIGQIWSMLELLHGAGIVHGQLDRGHLIVDEGKLGLTGFQASSVAPSENQIRTDRLQALITVALIDGPEQAVAAAIDAIGSDGVSDLLPLLQPATLTSDQRRAVRDGALDLDALRVLAATTLTIESPKLQQLRRFSVMSLLRIALPLVALYVIGSALASFDFREIGTQLAEAKWWIIAIAVVVAQLPRIGQSVATLGASPVPLPLGPLYALQLAVSYLNLAVPSAAARIAVNVRFFQRQGIGPGGALAAGAIDGVSGFIIQTCIMVSLVVFGSASLDLDLSPQGVGPSARLLVVVGVIVALALVVLVSIARLRRFVVHWARQIVTEAVAALRGLRSPRRMMMLFGGNLAAELLFACALLLMASAFGADLGLAEVLFVGVFVSMFSWLVPIPGGIGVTEGGLIFGLVSAGMDPEAAFAAVVLYRVSTFYLPPLWGYFALRWLERSDHL